MSENSTSVLLPEWFQPKDDDGNPTKGSFKIRCLNGMEYLELMSLGTVVGDNFQTNHQGKDFLVRRSLVDWKDMEDASGEPLKFSIATAYDHLFGEALLAIANKAFLKASLGEAERKNLQSQSKSSPTPSDSTVTNANGDATAIAETLPQ